MDNLLLYRFFKGQTTREEELALRKWVESSEENERQFYRQRKVFDLLTATQGFYHGASRKKTTWVRDCVRIAAAVIVTFICTAIGFHIVDSDKAIESSQLLMQTINVPKGQRINLDLPDGTNVWLNSGTTLRYPVDFGQVASRKVFLEGEGFFDVAHDKDRPFTVVTYAINVTALGTEFNVYANSKAAKFETSLLKGSVVLGDCSCNQLAIMEPNQKVTLMSDGSLHSSVITDFDSYRWTEGLYCFKSKHLYEIVKDLERYYDTRIDLESDKYNKPRITGKFRIREGIGSVMRVLQSELGFQYSYDKEQNFIEIR